MEIVKVNHFTVNVKDLQASIAFYSDVLKLPQGEMLDMGDHSLTYFALPSGLRLELIDYRQPVGVCPQSPGLLGRFRHICLEVSDMYQAYIVCRQHGVEVVSPPTVVGKLGRKTMLILDPNGVEIEFWE